VVTSSSASQ